MTTYARNLHNVHLSMFGFPVSGAGTDGFIEISMPKYIEHVDGQGGDAVHYGTGLSTATFTLKVLQSSAINELLIGVVNASKLDPTTNAQGAFLLKDINTGQTISGTCTLDGYPTTITQNSEETNYTYEGRIFGVDMKIASRAIA